LASRPPFDAQEPAVRNHNAALRLFYDETNNFRRLYLNDAKPNASVEKTFVIAGIALRAGQTLTGWSQLRQAIRMQPNAAELKFTHVASGDYEHVLSSRRLEVVLRWLRDQDVLIHYNVLDTLHWSALDIVESLMEHSPLIMEKHAGMKNELTHAARLNLPAFLALLHRYDFPDVKREKASAFLEALLVYLGQALPEDRNDATRLLRLALRMAMEDGLEMTYIHDNDAHQLIDNFSAQFLWCGQVFRQATHRFDRESYIEKRLRKRFPAERPFDYEFVDSKSEIGIQVSDVIAGLVGRHFDYILGHNWPELRAAKAGFTPQQLVNLRLLRDLIAAAHDFSEGLLWQVVPIDTLDKHSAFLHGTPVPAYLQ
jgi:hypothetical protein